MDDDGNLVITDILFYDANLIHMVGRHAADICASRMTLLKGMKPNVPLYILIKKSFLFLFYIKAGIIYWWNNRNVNKMFTLA
jgi:hypothetical protein